jgi:chromosome segregation and condensation protein ScpB
MLCDSRKNPDNKNDYEKNSMNLVIFDEQFKNQKMKQKKEKLKKLFLQKLI